MAELQPGVLLGERFEVHGVLGRGGMATVYLALDRESGERVALKLLHDHLSSQAGARRRLEREIEAARRLDHPGVLVARELVELDSQLGLLLPLHSGRTLAEAVAMDGPLSADQVRRLGKRLAEALEAAHRAGVLHRDLTARNVLIDDRGAPVLTDFGLARLMDQRTARSTALLGTAGFVAPEVLAGRRADPRSDLYGLGAVLYQAATGKEPFGGAHPQAAIQAQMAGDVVPLTQAVPGFPAWLDAVILGLLSPDPDRRPQGAVAVVEALERMEAPPIVEDAQVVDLPPKSGTLVAATLPQGTWTVAVRELKEDRDIRKLRRAVRRRARRKPRQQEGELEGVIDSAAQVVEKVAGWSEDGDEERKLADAVAKVAALPSAALRPSSALERDRFRLVAHVDRATADAVANEARTLGLKATVLPEREGTDAMTLLAEFWWVLIPLMWVLFPPIVAIGGEPLILFAFVAATILLPTVIGPWAERKVLPKSVRDLPIAYTSDLSAHLEEGFAAQGLDQTPSGGSAVEEQVLSRADRLSLQAVAALDALDAGLRHHASDLPDVVASDLQRAVQDLRLELTALADTLARLDAALAAQPDEGGGWAAERLARLETLARAGQPVDPRERERLGAAVAAHEAAMAAEQALDSERTSTLARVLEIGATARRMTRELELDQAQERSPGEALDDLRRRAAAARKARGELG